MYGYIQLSFNRGPVTNIQPNLIASNDAIQWLGAGKVFLGILKLDGSRAALERRDAAREAPSDDVGLVVGGEISQEAGAGCGGTDEANSDA